MSAKIELFLEHRIIFPNGQNADNVLVYILDNETGHQILFKWSDELVIIKDTITQDVLSTYTANYHTFLTMFVDLNPVDDVYDFLSKNNMLDSTESEQRYYILMIKNESSEKVFFQVYHTSMTREEIKKDVKAQLNYGKHWNKHLQHSWNKHGDFYFEFYVFDIPESYCQTNDKLDEYLEEQKKIRKQKGYSLYNYKNEWQNWE